MDLKMARFKHITGLGRVQYTQEEEAEADKKEEAEAEYNRLHGYILKRKTEYPGLEDCIHALLDGGKILEDLQKKRADIKKKYPKPKV